MNDLVQRIKDRRKQYVKAINSLESDPTPENIRQAEIGRKVKYELDDLLTYALYEDKPLPDLAEDKNDSRKGS